jgi:hypothetical protein
MASRPRASQARASPVAPAAGRAPGREKPRRGKPRRQARIWPPSLTSGRAAAVRPRGARPPRPASLTKASRTTGPGRRRARARQPGPAARRRAGARPLAASPPPSGGVPKRPPRTTSRPAQIQQQAALPQPLTWIRLARPGLSPAYPGRLRPRPAGQGRLAIQPASPVRTARTSAPRNPARTGQQARAAVCSGRCRGWPGQAQPGRTWLGPAEPGRPAPDRAKLDQARAAPAGAGPASRPLAWPTARAAPDWPGQTRTVLLRLARRRAGRAQADPVNAGRVCSTPGRPPRGRLDNWMWLDLAAARSAGPGRTPARLSRGRQTVLAGAGRVPLSFGRLARGRLDN